MTTTHKRKKKRLNKNKVINGEDERSLERKKKTIKAASRAKPDRRDEYGRNMNNRRCIGSY